MGKIFNNNQLKIVLKVDIFTKLQQQQQKIKQTQVICRFTEPIKGLIMYQYWHYQTAFYLS